MERIDRQCDYCHEVKDWKRFIPKQNKHNYECRDCYSERVIHKRIEEAQVPWNKNPGTWEDMIKAVSNKCS